MKIPGLILRGFSLYRSREEVNKMSAAKNRSLTRRINLLNQKGIYLNCEGGMAMSNPDIQRLLQDGHMTLFRESWKGCWNYTLSRSKACITESGKAFLNRHKNLINPKPTLRTSTRQMINAYNIGREKIKAPKKKIFRYVYTSGIDSTGRQSDFMKQRAITPYLDN